MKHLSRFDIEAIADKYVQAYMALPDVRNTQIYRIDPELLLEKVLGLNVEYQHLSYDGSILGMTSFTEMGVQVFEDDDNEAFFFLDGKTVLVEKDLNFDSKLKGRKNFTLMHEGSHQIFKMLFPNDYGVTQKSAGVHYYKANSERNKPISDWEEWQANTLGAAILLPENLIKQGMYLFSLGEKIECLNKIYYPSVYKRFDALADFLGCSKKALAIRMKQLHTVLHQILDMAVDDDYIRNNPSNNVLKELKQSHCFQTEKRRALTKPEQELFLDYLKNSPTSKYWYPVFAVMIGTGLRVGEVTGLRWCDIDLEEGIIDVNHTLVYYDHRTEGSKRGCYFNVNTTKTPAGRRKVPMLGFVKEAFLMEKERQELLDLHCEATVDGYTDFIFINRFGQPQHQATLNKAIRRIIRDCNDEQLLKDENAEVLLPHFSCHSLRHTFTTRMCEAGVNVKVIQDTLGHKDISTTLNIYTDVTKELRKSEFEGLDSYFKNEYNKVSV